MSPHKAIALALLLAPVRNALAQGLDQKDIVAIERAAAGYVASSLPAGRIVFDAHVDGAKQRASDHATVLATMLKARQLPADSVLKCADGPKTCRLDADALVLIGSPKVTSEGARITVEIRKPTKMPRIPVSAKTQELILSRKGSGWLVTGLGRIGIT